MNGKILFGAVVVCVLIELSVCVPQLTFSNDWSGGRRDTLASASNEQSDLNKLESEIEGDLEKRAPGWGKRAPGWGKRSSLNEKQVSQLENLYKDYERKAYELKRLLEIMESN